MLKLKTPKPFCRVDVSRWDPDAEAYIKTFSKLERMIFHDLGRIYSNMENPPKERATAIARIAIMALVDKNGNRLLTEEDLPAVLEAERGTALRIMEINLGLEPPPSEESFKKK